MSAETYSETFDYGNLNGRFASIDSANSIDGYEWDEFHVLRGVDGHLYVGDDSGCSCNSFADSDGSRFTRVATWQDAAAKAQEWANEVDWNREQRTNVVMDLIERLNAARPVAHLEIALLNPWGQR